MNVPFNFESIRSVDFFVCFDTSDGEQIWHVPVDADVQDALREMLGHTLLQLNLDETEIPLFEPGEKYGAIEVSSVPISHDYMQKVRSIYQTDHFDTNANALRETNRLAFYFAAFHDAADQKLLGIKRAGQFKGILRARNRLVAVIDDTLKLLHQDVFRLDQDFDYVVSATDVIILRPAGFEYTAAIDEAIGDHASQVLRNLNEAVPTIDFAGLEEFVLTHKRAARLVASLNARSDLARTSRTHLRRECSANQIGVTTSAGRIAPQTGNEMAFLELLDRRRYTIELIEDEAEFYVAASRHGGRTPPAV